MKTPARAILLTAALAATPACALAEVPDGRDADDHAGVGDTDAIRFHRGCVVSGYDHVLGAPDLLFFTDDRRGKDSLWTKISDNEDYTITSITCG